MPVTFLPIMSPLAAPPPTPFPHKFFWKSKPLLSGGFSSKLWRTRPLLGAKANCGLLHGRALPVNENCSLRPLKPHILTMHQSRGLEENLCSSLPLLSAALWGSWKAKAFSANLPAITELGLCWDVGSGLCLSLGCLFFIWDFRLH